VLLVVVAGVVGYLLGGTGEQSSTSGLSDTAAVGHLQLRYPPSWQFGVNLPAVPGMTLDEPLAIAAAHASAGLTAGRARGASVPTLLPAAFRGQVEGPLPHGEAVMLGSLQAYRYGPLHVRGLAGAVTVFVVPTTTGVATIDCWSSQRTATGVQAECGRMAATLRLVGASAYPLGPSVEYANAVSQRFTQLNDAVRSPLSSLTSASTPSQQAAALQSLASAWATAARELQAVAVPPAAAEAQQTIVAALQSLSSGYASAAAAARSGNAGAYAAASHTIASASAKLNDGLRQLGALGYTVAV